MNRKDWQTWKDDKGNERKEINEGGKRDGIPDDILEFRGRVPRGGGGGGGGKSIGWYYTVAPG